MTISLNSLIEEWEAVNVDLYKASLESHQRYPFPTNLFCLDDATKAAAAESVLASSSDIPSSPFSFSADSSIAVYARVYHLVSHVRYIAEDARYNSFNILQHLLWVTIVAWANQLAIAAGGVIDLPVNLRQSGAKVSPASDPSLEASAPAAAAAAAPPRTLFVCPLLSPLTFWDPDVLAEAAGGGGSPQTHGVGGAENFTSASVHRAPNLPDVWAKAVGRIITMWCTPTVTPHNLLSVAAAAHQGDSSPPRPHLHEAYVWVLIAQHYHRFKAILSLFFLRYDAHLEVLEEQQRRRGKPAHPQQPHSVVVEPPGGVSPVYPPTQPLRRRGPHFRVPSDVSTSSLSPASVRTGAPVTGSSSNNNNNSNTRPPPSDERAPDNRSAAASRSSAPQPSTARLLAMIMRSIQTVNINTIMAATAEVAAFLLMPPVHRARLREKVMKARQQQQQQQWGEEGVDGSKRTVDAADPPRQNNGDTLTEPEWLASVFVDGCTAEDEEEDDKVVWSVPPSPLLSFSNFESRRSGASSFSPVDESFSLDDAARATKPHCSIACVPPALERGQKDEYVIRNFYKLLLMAEDCRVYALQHWLVEAGKQVVAVYGSQLASLFFEEGPTSASKTPRKDREESTSGQGASASPALTVHTLADANRVLRETIQSYVRLRTKLLFLNAGTTHFLEVLTPWGRTRVLEKLNAFLCGFCGVTLPSSSAAPDFAGGGGSGGDGTRGTAASRPSTFDAAQYFTPTNAAVAAFARTWAVPLWTAMCEDTQHRLEVLQIAKQTRERARAVGRVRSSPLDPSQLPVDAKGCSGSATECHGSPLKPLSPSLSTKYRREPTFEVDVVGSDDRAEELRSATDAREMSVASGDLGDAVSRAPSAAGVWPPSSPTTGRATQQTRGSGGGGLGVHDVDRVRSRGVDLRRVLQQHQRQRVPFGLALPRPGVDNAAPIGSDSGGGGGLEESLYSAETVSVGEVSWLHTTAAANAGADGEAQFNVNNNSHITGSLDEVEGSAVGVPANNVEAAVAAARRRRRQAAAAVAAAPQEPQIIPGTTPRFSRAAQLHQVATLPDEGFPSLMYLMPRRSRFIAQDKAAASVQQALFTRFSSDVHRYLSSLLAECEAAEQNKDGPAREAPPDVAGSGELKRAKTKKKRDATAAPAASNRLSADGGVRPLPQPVLHRMIFLMDMTYAALQGNGGVDSRDGKGNGPLMETGLTATGQELGAGILEQDNGEYESVVSTTLSAPTSPAVLTIAAVRKGFQGFLAAQEKRAVVTLAQALYNLIQEGVARQPPTASLESVDTILNMSSLLNSKDLFVSLIKGYIAPQVMMCRSLNEVVVESQVVARMAYRLGSAVAAPCLTLLRDLRLAMSDPLNITGEAGPLSFTCEGDEDNNSANLVDQENGGVTAESAQLVATRNAQTLAAAGPLRHGLFGLIHRMRILCQAWWRPHTAALLSSRKLQHLWERYQLLDERIIDAVLRVEWRYNGHTEPFYRCARIPGDPEFAGTDDDTGDGHCSKGKGGVRMRSNISDGGLSGSTRSNRRGHHPNLHCVNRGGVHGSASAVINANTRRGGTAAAVIQGFSSALGNAVRRTGHHTGAFGNNESDNESEDYSEAYGGLLTLNTLQQHRGTYAASSSSYRGSNVSSVGGGGGGTGDYRDASDGGHSTVPDDTASTAVPPDGERERRQLRWPLSDGQLVFFLYPKNSSATAASAAASQAVQISGPPLTLLVCQLMDRAANNSSPSSSPYTFDKLHKALPVQTPKPLLAHLLHELVKAGVVTRSVPSGTRQYAYQLRDDVQHLHQRKIAIDVRAAAQKLWVTYTLMATESDAGDDVDHASQRNPMSPASPAGVPPAFPPNAAQGTGVGPSSTTVHRDAGAVGGVTSVPPRNEESIAVALTEQPSPVYSADRMHKIKVCIVRIMKAERVLPHRELLERVAVALEDQFVVTSSQFKRCVAHLIEREFLQRSEGGEEYMYLS
jgi:hypothetical protein